MTVRDGRLCANAPAVSMAYGWVPNSESQELSRGSEKSERERPGPAIETLELELRLLTNSSQRQRWRKSHPARHQDGHTASTPPGRTHSQHATRMDTHTQLITQRLESQRDRSI